MIACWSNSTFKIWSTSWFTDIKYIFTCTRATKHVETTFFCVCAGLSNSLSYTFFITAGWFIAGNCVITKWADIVVGFRMGKGFGSITIAVNWIRRFSVAPIFAWFDVVCIVLDTDALPGSKGNVIRSTLVVSTRIMSKSWFLLNIRLQSYCLYLRQ